MNSYDKRILETIKVLKWYMKEYSVSFEKAVSDWDEPWKFSYLYDVVKTYRNETPSDNDICKLAGINVSYWEDFKENN